MTTIYFAILFCAEFVGQTKEQKDVCRCNMKIFCCVTDYTFPPFFANSTKFKIDCTLLDSIFTEMILAP